MIWRCHNIPCFHFCFLFRNNGIREELYQNDFCCCYERLLLLLWWNLFRKCYSASTWSQLCSKTPWQWHMKDTLQLKILPTWVDLGVEPASRHLTYCSKLFFLSNKPSFCYSNNFCRNLFTFLCLKVAPPLPPPLINFSNVFQPGHSYSNLSPPLIFHKALVLVSGENYWC